MNRKFFRAIALLTVFITFQLVSTNSIAAVKWQLAQTWGNEHLLGYPTARLSELINELSGGDFQIELVSKKEHKNTRGIFDFVKEGKYQMGHSASNFWKKKDPDTMFFSAVPFGMVTPELYSWFYEGGGLELMNRVYAKHGLMSFPGGNSGHQMIGWFNKQITSLEDLKGLKMRLPGLAGEVMASLGVEIINVPVGELRSALESGKVEAVEFVGPAIDLNMKFQEVSRYYYTGWHSPSSEMQFLVNPKAYQALSKKNKNLLKHAMRLAAYDGFIKIVNENGSKIVELREKYPNVVLQSFPPKVLRALNEATKKTLEGLAANSPDGITREIIDSMAQHAEKTRLWTRFSDQAYLSNVGGI